jgi:serine-type D-Ala-D-Ala carboxypeptidase (penicillin-binding protein 5/6)
VVSSRRGRGNAIGYAFLGIAVLLTIGTLFLALTDRSLADLDLFADDDGSTNPGGKTLAELSATAAVSATPTPTPAGPDPIPSDLELTAQAAYVVHADTGNVLFERDADEFLQPASTLKIFTAMVVLEYASREEVIEIVDSDLVDPVEESSMGLEAGDRVTIHDLLVGLMLPSGNDAANALARTIGARIDGDEAEPPEERFIRAMNQVAADLGLEETTLDHVSGHDRDGQGVTAREMAIATQSLLEKPTLAAIVAMKRADVQVGGANPRIIQLENTNELLVNSDVTGVKTGTTAQAGQCLIVAQRNDDGVTVTVLLGSTDRYADARVLLGLPEPPESDDFEPGPEHTDPVDESTESTP